jgi:hypothetical protein
MIDGSTIAGAMAGIDGASTASTSTEIQFQNGPTFLKRSVIPFDVLLA